MQQSVFGKLYRLLNLNDRGIREDFLTEIVAELFRDSTIATSFFMEFADAVKLSGVSVQTQVTYTKLSGHQTDSRPDTVVKFTHQNMQHVAFLENKLGAGEGERQLQRYADHLRVYEQNGWKTYLFYITQFPDKKQSVHHTFIQLRWYQVFQWLKRCFPSHSYAEKVIEYMEEIGLDETRQFNPHDMYAIQQLNRLQRMMDECMDGPVDELMNTLFGRPLQQYNRYNQMKYMNRYFKASEQNDRATEVGCGFYLTYDDYPIVSVVYEVNRSCPDKLRVIECMKQFTVNHGGWETFDLNSQDEWVGISYDRSLLEFLPYDDHIAEIQKFFLEKLQELHQLRVDFPDLHWK